MNTELRLQLDNIQRELREKTQAEADAVARAQVRMSGVDMSHYTVRMRGVGTCCHMLLNTRSTIHGGQRLPHTVGNVYHTR